MVIELSNLTFTEQDDIVPASGVEEILINTGIANTLAGNDSITGDTTNSISGETNGIYNSGTLNTDDGNDIITGIFNSAINDPFTGSGIYNVEGIIDTGEGNDILTGIGIYRGILGQSGTLDTGNGNDIITGTGFFGIENNWDIFNTGDGSDIITGIGTQFGGILNSGPINTGAGNDIISGTTSSGSGIENSSNGSIDTGDGNDIITAIGNYYILYNSGSIDTGNGNDSIIAEEANDSSLPLYSSANYGTINTGNGNDSISLQGGLYNMGGGMFLGEGNDTLTLTPPKDDIPNRALVNTSILETGDGDDIITTSGFIDNDAVFGEGVINMGNGKDSLIAEGGFEGSGNVFLGNGKDYLKGFGSGNFNGGNAQDALELTSGSYIVGRSGTAVNFTKDSITMNTSEFEILIAGNTIYNFASLTNGQTISIA